MANAKEHNNTILFEVIEKSRKNKYAYKKFETHTYTLDVIEIYRTQPYDRIHILFKYI